MVFSGVCHTSLPEHSTGVLYKDGMLTKLGPAMDLLVYNQHHCWVLLSSLCLTAANTINTATDTRGRLGGRVCWNFEEENVHMDLSPQLQCWRRRTRLRLVGLCLSVFDC